MVKDLFKGQMRIKEEVEKKKMNRAVPLALLKR